MEVCRSVVFDVPIFDRWLRIAIGSIPANFKSLRASVPNLFDRASPPGPVSRE